MNKKKALSIICILGATFWCVIQSGSRVTNSQSYGLGFPSFAEAKVKNKNEFISDHSDISVRYTGFSLLVLVPSVLSFASGYLWSAAKKRGVNQSTQTTRLPAR